jgi:predicted nucleic acid-binding protein
MMGVDVCFVDTSAWFEMFIPKSETGKSIRAMLRSLRYKLHTSDFVLDELLTVLKREGHGRLARKAWEFLNNKLFVRLIHLTPDDMLETYSVFDRFSDKDWSFTDCSSYMLIKRHKIEYACAIDKHFREFGIVRVLPHPKL